MTSSLKTWSYIATIVAVPTTAALTVIGWPNFRSSDPAGQITNNQGIVTQGQSGGNNTAVTIRCSLAINGSGNRVDCNGVEPREMQRLNDELFDRLRNFLLGIGGDTGPPKDLTAIRSTTVGNTGLPKDFTVLPGPNLPVVSVDNAGLPKELTIFPILNLPVVSVDNTGLPKELTIFPSLNLPVVSTGNTELPKDLTVFPSLNLPVISVANTTSAVPNCQTGGC